jgi:hypothetical protein
MACTISSISSLAKSSSRFHSGSRKAKSRRERPEDDDGGGGDDLLGLLERHGRLACSSRSRARRWTGRGREEEDAVRVNFRELHGYVISEPTPPVRFIYADLSWGPDETRDSLCAAAARVAGLAVHAKPGAHPRTR